MSFDDTFFLADVFIPVSPNWRREGGESNNPRSATISFVKTFGDPHGAPTPDEIAMAHAYTASLASSALSRRVGAALTDPRDSSILATGKNEVPKYGGSTYSGQERKDQDGRDLNFNFSSSDHAYLQEDQTGGDSNDFIKLDILKDIVKRMLPLVKIETAAVVDSIRDAMAGSDGPDVDDEALNEIAERLSAQMNHDADSVFEVPDQQWRGEEIGAVRDYRVRSHRPRRDGRANYGGSARHENRRRKIVLHDVPLP